MRGAERRERFDRRGARRKATRRRFITFALVLSAGIFATPVRADVFTLREAEQSAFRHRPTLDVVRARVRQARAEVDRVVSSRRPSLSLEAGTSIQPSGELIRVQDITGDTFLVQGTRELGESRAFLPVPRYEAALVFRSNLFDFGRTRAAMRAARAGRRAAQADEEAAGIELRSAVRASYLIWYQAHAQHALFTQLHDDAIRRRLRVEERIALGARPPAERTAALHDELSAALDARRTEQQLASARLALGYTVGRPIPTDAEPDPSVVEVAPPSVLPSDPRVEALEARRTSAVAAAEFRRGQRLPVLMVAAQTGFRGQLDRFFPNYRLAVTFSVPLWDGGGLTADIDAARARTAELSAQLEQVRRDFLQSVEQARIDRLHAEARLQVIAGLVRVSEQRLAQAEEQYEIGVGSLEAIADARAMVGRARVEAISAQVAAADAAFRLMD